MPGLFFLLERACFTVHSSVYGHLGCFYLLAVMNNAAMTIHVQVLGVHVFSFLLGVYTGSCGNYV